MKKLINTLFISDESLSNLTLLIRLLPTVLEILKSMLKNGKGKTVPIVINRNEQPTKRKQRLDFELSRRVIWHYFFLRIMVVRGLHLMLMRHIIFFVKMKHIDLVGGEIGYWQGLQKSKNGRL